MTVLDPAPGGPKRRDTIASNGQMLAYEQFGKDRDPVLLLIMGLGTQLLAWPDAFCQALAKAGLRVIRFDNRDVGLSSKLDGITDYDRPRQAMIKVMLGQRIDAPYSLQDLADDAIGLLDDLDIGQAHVAGVSMGGMIAQLMAGHYPQRVLSLTSIMSSSSARELPSGKLKVLRRMGRRPAAHDEDTIVAHMTRTMLMLGGALGPDADAWAEDVRKAYRRNYYPPGVSRQMLAVMSAPSRVALLQGIAQPALVIHGTADPLLPVEHGRSTARHLPNVRYEEIEGMGHSLPPQHLADFVDMIVALVQEARQNANSN